ncbi:hypothetical protein J5U22_03166 [Saccharolobus shibatae]|uniref:Uncharacterized protein n=1 Tax=Saccharolobus shibatae TaxID=2286 RepID=A0A8F5C3P6_9CREN|nr:hypothetical protein J5U22_03166 [Saccharolobus shibatae]
MANPSLNYLKQVKKPLCPFGRHCFTDSSICGDMGRYAECPVYRGVDNGQKNY